MVRFGPFLPGQFCSFFLDFLTHFAQDPCLQTPPPRTLLPPPRTPLQDPSAQISHLFSLASSHFRSFFSLGRFSRGIVATGRGHEPPKLGVWVPGIILREQNAAYRPLELTENNPREAQTRKKTRNFGPTPFWAPALLGPHHPFSPTPDLAKVGCRQGRSRPEQSPTNWKKQESGT